MKYEFMIFTRKHQGLKEILKPCGFIRASSTKTDLLDSSHQSKTSPQPPRSPS